MTNKEKYLLMFLAGIIVIAIYWFALYSPLQDKTAVLKNEVQDLDNELSLISIEYANKETYIEETEQAKEYIESVNTRYPAGLNQEGVIHTMLSLEEAVDSLTIQSYTIGNVEEVLQNDQFISAEETEEESYERVIKVPVNLSVQTSYNDYKKILGYIGDYPTHLSFDNMNINNDLTNSLVQSSFAIHFYALESSERPFEPADYFGPFEPKEDSIFKPLDMLSMNYNAGNSDGEVREPDDLIIGLTSINSALETVGIYHTADEENTRINADNPNNEPIEIHVSQSEGIYYYRYKTSVSEYPADYDSGQPFDPGTMIDLKVISSRRYDDNDLSGVNAVLINETDIPMNVRVEYEDANRPRFNVVEQRGNIVFK